jgi:hypothetical protein
LPFLARRGGCAEGADGVVDPIRKVKFLDQEQPPRRFAPPLLARRGNRKARISSVFSTEFINQSLLILVPKSVDGALPQFPSLVTVGFGQN